MHIVLIVVVVTCIVVSGILTVWVIRGSCLGLLELMSLSERLRLEQLRTESDQTQRKQ
jgi:hypothetical protein